MTLTDSRLSVLQDLHRRMLPRRHSQQPRHLPGAVTHTHAQSVMTRRLQLLRIRILASDDCKCDFVFAQRMAT